MIQSSNADANINATPRESCNQQHPPILKTVRQFSEDHPAFSQGSIRNLIFLADQRKTSTGIIPGNGLAPAIVRIGRKVLIDETKFFEWIESQNSGVTA